MARNVFQVKSRHRQKLQRSLQKYLRFHQFRESGSLIDSIRIGAEFSKLNRLDITITALFYYLFLDEGTSNPDGSVKMVAQDITSKWANYQEVDDIIAEATQEYVKELLKHYSILILNDRIKKIDVYFTLELYGDDKYGWNGQYKTDANTTVKI
jgi:hypothetical protein